MKAYYDKVIVKTKGEDKEAVVIFNEKTHTPEFFMLDKCGMDEVLALLNKGEELGK
jgi:hypothetical protein